KAGHVTGGRVFGYDNVRTATGHVERVINQKEAAVVRRIFELSAKGWGRIAIAKKLNAEGAPAPRSQQGRPTGGAHSTIHEVLHRDLYRGEPVWNKTRKRDSWGQVKQVARPEADWIRRSAPALRIVSDALWQEVHRRLGQKRESYLRATGGRLNGRP